MSQSDCSHRGIISLVQLRMARTFEEAAWMKADPRQDEPEVYVAALQSLGEFMAKTMPEDLRDACITPLDVQPFRELVEGVFSKKKGVTLRELFLV